MKSVAITTILLTLSIVVFAPITVVSLEGTTIFVDAAEINNNNNTNNNNDNYLTYENPAYGVRMQYPSDWKIVSGGNITTKFYNEVNTGLNIVAEFLAPEQSQYFKQNDPNTHNSLGIIVENYSSSSFDSLDKQLSNFGIKRIVSIISQCPDFEVISMNKSAALSSSSDNNNIQAYQVVYQYTHEGAINKANEIWTIKDGKSYLVAYGGHESFYDMYLSDIEYMFDSFEIRG
jgi:hypothetical protein